MKAATVGLDLRAAGRAAAVAVDARGALLAWALVDGEGGDGDRAALAKAALGKLAVRVRSLRVLLGAEAAPVGFFAGEGPPGEREIAEALLAEGYEPAAEGAVAAVRVASAAGGSWLVTAGDGEALARLADRLLAEAGAEPAFVVDQLLAAARLDEGAAVVEYGEAGLLIAARPSRSPALVRALPDLPDAEEAARECRATLDPSGPSLGVRLLGSRRDELARALAGSGLEILEEPLPAGGSQPLPAGLELIFRLALDAAAPALLSPRIERRGKSLAWARRATRAALAAALGGLLLAAAGLWTTWSHRARSPQEGAGAPEVAQQVEQVRQLAALADRIEQRRTEAAGQTAPWPRLAETLAGLARELPPETGWEKLAVADGTLELRASATGGAPRRKLELLRSALARSPGLLNLSWEEPTSGKPGTRVRQVFKAALREPRA